MEGKINFHVRKYLREQNEKNNTVKPSEDSVYEYLIATYREYERKPQNQLKKMVSKAVKNFRNREKDDKTIKKRQRIESGSGRQDSSEEDERIAVELEKQQISHSGSNMLNNSIRKKYVNSTPVKENPSKSSEMTPKKAKTKSRNNDDLKRKSPESSDEGGYICTRPTIRYSDIGGIQSILQEVKELIEYPLIHPEIYTHLGVEPPRGILLHGPPGTGKTMLANAIAGECGASFLRVSAPEMVSGMSGESEQKLRALFKEAIENAPSIIFIDEIDAITPKRETSQRGMEKRIVAQLLTSTDSLSLENTGGKPVVIIGATNRPDALDSALRRAGRFDREICVGIPDEDARERILTVLSKKMKLSGDFNFKSIARKTPGFVGADLVSLTKEAAVIAVNRIFSTLLQQPQICASSDIDMEIVDDSKADAQDKNLVAVGEKIRNVTPFTEVELAPLSVSMGDFLLALPKVQPSSKREGFAVIPDVTWDDVGALVSVREELILSILHPIRYPERFAALGLSMPAGVLLYGPPGCGKTLLAKAIANESGANFISIKGPELLDKYVGESERAVRQVFQRARASSPCVVFFDELDALCPRRGGSDSGNGVSERVVNQLLTEMDGLDGRKNVFVIAATNRPDIIDPAMLRPGRLDKLLYVPLPTASDRVSILKTLTKKTVFDSSVIIDDIGRDHRLEGFSGADLSALVREAGICVLRELDMENNANDDVSKFSVTKSHFEKALLTVFPSVSRADQRIFDKMKRTLRKSRGHLSNSEVDNTTESKSPAGHEPGSEITN